MDLIYCNKCGVVLNRKVITWPPIYDEVGEFIDGNSEWNGEEYVQVIPCPVCNNRITND